MHGDIQCDLLQRNMLLSAELLRIKIAARQLLDDLTSDKNGTSRKSFVELQKLVKTK